MENIEDDDRPDVTIICVVVVDLLLVLPLSTLDAECIHFCPCKTRCSGNDGTDDMANKFRTVLELTFQIHILQTRLEVAHTDLVDETSDEYVNRCIVISNCNTNNRYRILRSNRQDLSEKNGCFNIYPIRCNI
jgi:hypothetical protein